MLIIIYGRYSSNKFTPLFSHDASITSNILPPVLSCQNLHVWSLTTPIPWAQSHPHRPLALPPALHPAPSPPHPRDWPTPSCATGPSEVLWQWVCPTHQDQLIHPSFRLLNCGRWWWGCNLHRGKNGWVPQCFVQDIQVMGDHGCCVALTSHHYYHVAEISSLRKARGRKIEGPYPSSSN